MRKFRDERKKILERLTAYQHRDMIPVQHNAVFVVVAVGGILEVPITAAECYRNKPDILAGRVCMVAVEAFVFLAEQAFRVAGGFDGLGLCDVAGVFFGLGHVDCDVEVAEAGLSLPADIAGGSLGTYVVG